jgi:hypothetical protein
MRVLLLETLHNPGGIIRIFKLASKNFTFLGNQRLINLEKIMIFFRFGGSLPRRSRTKAEPHLRADQRYAGEFVLGLPERKEKIPNFRHPQSQHTLPIFQPPPRQSMISSFPPPQMGSSFNSSHSQLPNSSYTTSQNQQMPPKFIPPPMSSTIPPFPSPQTHSSMYPSSQTQKVIPPFSSPQSQSVNDSQWSFVTARESLSQSQSTFFDAATSFGTTNIFF